MWSSIEEDHCKVKSLDQLAIKLKLETRVNNPKKMNRTAVNTLTVGSPAISFQFAFNSWKRSWILEGDFDFEDVAFFAIADLGCFIQK